ncbi:hypothetical protein QBC46DRAFT_32445 [Diplogelasinospora grovesii]|uniref:Transmembrane protein n=1 Tax=Diplogelasinospora grovesii TaxID=303347 RepID=A0AAN6MZD0_9PEZI|nr:hypothetical protein QBC46DRAFT_32445 [Diplogelasinospora grovesii]
MTLGMQSVMLLAPEHTFHVPALTLVLILCTLLVCVTGSVRRSKLFHPVHVIKHERPQLHPLSNSPLPSSSPSVPDAVGVGATEKAQNEHNSSSPTQHTSVAVIPWRTCFSLPSHSPNPTSARAASDTSLDARKGPHSSAYRSDDNNQEDGPLASILGLHTAVANGSGSEDHMFSGIGSQFQLRTSYISLRRDSGYESE